MDGVVAKLVEQHRQPGGELSVDEELHTALSGTE
jgi:hypothetical protein